MATEPRFFSNVPGADKKVLYHKYHGPKDPHAKGVECVDPYDNKVYDEGDVWVNQEECNRKTCQKDGTVKEERCLDDLEFPKECKEIRDHDFMNLEYPWCCPRIACPGDEFYIPDEHDFDHFCYEKNTIRKEGEQWADKGKCHLKTCKKYHIVKVDKCPKYKIPKGCTLTDPDLSKKYPDCCPTVTCPPGKGPKDGKFKRVDNIERPVSIYEWSDLFTTTSERILNPEGIKPRENYEEIEKTSKKECFDKTIFENSKKIKEPKKLKENLIQEEIDKEESVIKRKKRKKQKK